jgi:hypothetical protein
MDAASARSSTSRSQTYKYTPLKETWNIRLLHHKPLNDDPHPEINFLESSFDEARNLGYEGLSYAWGPAVFSEQILVDDKHLPVRPTLLAALKALAQDQPRLLWVDAICKAQNDLVEKEFQIPLMTEIYSSAKQVLVWLGEETEDARVVLD